MPENTLNKMFSNLSKFNILSSKLLKTSSYDEFMVIYEQLKECDKRTLYIYLCNNKENIPEEYIKQISKDFACNLIKKED